jgi:serine/threonine-protein kinase
VKCSACATPLDSRATFCPTCGRAIDDPFIGLLINLRYEVERRIAIGGFGSIYRAQQLDVDRKVALKIMHRELAADANLVARFRREGEVLIQLRDPNIVETYETGETHGLPFIVMELLEGESLLRLFHLHGRMEWRRMLEIVRGVCSALAEAHGRGIVHRDLKPGNVFVTTDERVKVLDFGIAKIMASSDMPSPQELTVMGTAVGTVEYMAPEQLMGGRADARTDIYTVGVLAYEMITGRRPFNAAGLDLLTVQLTEEPPPASTLVSVPADVDRLLLTCLAQDPADRFADVHELARACDAVLAAHPAVAAPPPPAAVRPVTALPTERPVMPAQARLPTEQFARAMPRSAFALLLAAAALLAVGLGLVLAYFL